jgi:hypothetical protein
MPRKQVGVPWRYSFWGTTVAGIVLLLLALFYPSFIPNTEASKISEQHLWELTDTLAGAFVGLLVGKGAP